MNAISIIVPTLNEADNIHMLVNRIADSFDQTDFSFELVFVDDRSTDGTQDIINSYADKYPVRLITKKGPRGKAYSLLQGFKSAEYDTICMIDADLQYPPEAIIPMFQLMTSTHTDIVLTNRTDSGTSLLRKAASSGFNFVFTKLLFGFDYDSQSGLKLFKKRVIDSVSLSPTPWSFDLEFIVRSLEKGYKIVSYDITFAERYAGVAKINVAKASLELAKASVKLRFDSSPKKVKEAYQSNLRFTQKTVQASVVAIAFFTALAGGLLISGQQSAYALTPANASEPITQTVLPPANNPAPAPPTPVTQTPTPSPSQTTQSSPVIVTNTPTASPTTAQTSPSQPSPSAKSSSNKTSTTVTNTRNTSGSAQPRTSSGSAAQRDLSSQASFPTPQQSAGGFSYSPARETSSRSFVKPLLAAGITIITATAALYSISGIVGAYRKNNTFQETVNQ